jgi:hypothetical protein
MTVRWFVCKFCFFLDLEAMVTYINRSDKKIRYFKNQIDRNYIYELGLGKT